MAARKGSRSQGSETSGAPVLEGAAKRVAPPARRCRACDRELSAPSDVGWECECGVVVCTSSECIEEYFRFVADGEATRCLSCGLVT